MLKNGLQLGFTASTTSKWGQKEGLIFGRGRTARIR